MIWDFRGIKTKGIRHIKDVDSKIEVSYVRETIRKKCPTKNLISLMNFKLPQRLPPNKGTSNMHSIIKNFSKSRFCVKRTFKINYPK